MTTHNHDVLMAISSRIINGRKNGAKQLNADYRALVKARDEILKLREKLAGYNTPPAAPVQEPVPIYQYKMSDGSWIDQQKDSYDYNVRHGKATVRIVYTTPPAPKKGQP
jgi:hypothetical protein